MLKKLQLTQKQFKILFNFCKKNKIKFLSTAFDLKSLNFINSLNPEFIKIPSGEITNFQLIKEITQLKKKVILSTGMSNLNEVLRTLSIYKNKQILLMSCRSSYPVDLKDIDLGEIKYLKEITGLNVGFSDHTEGFESSIVAVIKGASMIEKHVTLDKNLKGPDHKFSLNLDEFSDFVQKIRNTEKILNQKKLTKSKNEKKIQLMAMKSIVFKKSLKKNLSQRRTGSALRKLR